MLLRFRFENFRSFRNEQELSMVAASITERPEVARKIDPAGESVVPAAAIYGANASGKTNVLRALQFMAEAVKSSHKDWLPDRSVLRDAFRADERSKSALSRFAVDIVVDGTRFQYGFAFDVEKVAEEWLFAYPAGKRQIWFERAAESGIRFGAKLPGENKTIANLTRANSLFLSAAAQNNHTALSPVYRWFSRAVVFIRGSRSSLEAVTARACEADESTRGQIIHLLTAADLGISGLAIEAPKQLARTPTGLNEAVKLGVKELVRALKAEPTVRVLHRVGERDIFFDFGDESDGTQAYFGLLGPIVDAIGDGGIIFVDELDASLHPLLAIELIRLFNDPVRNPKNAQLIFTTHDTNLLSAGLLRRDQIWFTEKGRDAASHLYPLSDFKPRKAENLEMGYLQGRYGAIPFINSEAFADCFRSEE
jgi:uncharacterized protein